MKHAAPPGNAASATLIPPPDATPRHYSAFISYSHSDRKLAERLQARLEGYRLPHRLAKRCGVAKLRPVFVDRDDLAAASDLSTAIRAAIAQADFLIVLCTPRAAQSQWVGREIDFFRALHGDEAILCALFEGDETDFHERLLCCADGSACAPLAADFRRQGDGARLALLKLVAVLAGVGVDDLVRRDAQRQMRRVGLTSAAAAAVVAAIAIISFLAYAARAEAERESLRSAQAVEYQLNEMRRIIDAGGTLDMAAAINLGVELYYKDKAPPAELPVELALQAARLRQSQAEVAERRGQFPAATAEARAAWTITSNLQERFPGRDDVLASHAQSAFWVGYVAWGRGDVALASNFLDRYARITGQLRQRHPGDVNLFELGFVNSCLGSIALSTARDIERADYYFRTAQAAFVSAGKLPGKRQAALYELADGEAWLADVERLRGNLDGAMAHRNSQHEMIKALLAAEPSNKQYRTSLVKNQLGTARLMAAEGDQSGALGLLDDAHGEVSALLAEDASNDSLARQKRMIELFTARAALVLAGRRASALDDVERQLGDCETDWRRPANAEVGTLCSLLAAQLALQRGNRDAALAMLTVPRMAHALKSETLSPRWRLDFAADCRSLGLAAACPPAPPLKPGPAPVA